MKKVVILGASGHAHVVADIILASGDEVVAFLDDNPGATDRSGAIKDYIKYDNCEFVVGIGSTQVREQLSRLPLNWYTAIHPSAIISQSAFINEGTVVMPNAVINAGAKVGCHCIINSGAIVEHDDVIEDFVHVSVGAKLGGNVNVGRATWIGIGATVSNDINICGDSMIGAGSVVVKDIKTCGVYAGAPAKMIK